MSALAQITAYIKSQKEPKRSDMQSIHRLVRKLIPGCRLWFLDGKDASGKVVSNPNVGYGVHATPLADGKTREFYQVGFSGNSAGISVYILGIKDKKVLGKKFGKRIGQASVTGYCIRFKTLASVDIDVLAEAMQYGIAQSGVQA